MINGLKTHFDNAVTNYNKSYMEGDVHVKVIGDERSPSPNQGVVTYHTDSHRAMNANCYIKLTVLSCKLNSDGPWFDKNDLYIRFNYDGKIMKTRTIDNAGKEAHFNQEFILHNV